MSGAGGPAEAAGRTWSLAAEQQGLCAALDPGARAGEDPKTVSLGLCCPPV